jgi:hypothetical protein
LCCAEINVHCMTIIIFLLSTVKPPIEELECFLEFQIARQWSPPAFEMTVGPQRKESTLPVLQFSCLGSKLFISGRQVGGHQILVMSIDL